MIIKDYYIKNDLEYNIINNIIKYLISNNINYLYIKDTNELHFDNYILRFKSNKELKELLFYEFMNMLNSICDKTYNDFFDYKDYVSNNKLYEKNNFKNIQKINNTSINTKGLTKMLKKQLNPTRKIYK